MMWDNGGMNSEIEVRLCCGFDLGESWLKEDFFCSRIAKGEDAASSDDASVYMGR